MRRLFVDTSAWFAFLNQADPDHERVGNFLENFEGRLVTSNFVFDETVTLCLYRLGWKAAAKFGESLLDSATVDLIRVTSEDERAAWSLFLERADKTYSFTDCTSFQLMRRLGIRKALALDTDFEREGFEIEPAHDLP
ncbi:PIN domain-containing protein [Acidobacteria bacterium AH-259-A15]|nr:PIN domain-containing protein [Acidobacteria bacterium AH-259-A15]